MENITPDASMDALVTRLSCAVTEGRSVGNLILSEDSL
jgi:hypothetical protein